jgi:hypothetical protein
MQHFLYTGHPVWYLVHCIRRKTLLFVAELVVLDLLTVYISKLMKNVHKKKESNENRLQSVFKIISHTSKNNNCSMKFRILHIM